MVRTVFLLLLSNIFMTYAWYGHLKSLRSEPIMIAIIISWGIAFFEYCLQVPANRTGFAFFSLPQLKVIQEIIAMAVFAVFAVLYMNVSVNRNFLYASLCLAGAAFFIFRDGSARP